MARQPRNALPDTGFFHVMSRGAGPLAIFLDDPDRLAFMARLCYIAQRFSWACHAYCLMTTHYHVVVQARLALLSRGMHRLNGPYAQRFNKRHGRTGHLFEGRFAVRVLESEEYLEAACDYVLQNPVRAGLCDNAAEWRWSGPASSLG
jgi:putative transposase